MRLSLALSCAAVAFATLSNGTAIAADNVYPKGLVRLVTASAAGGTPDAVFRVIADRLSAMNGGTPFIIENRPGGATLIATRMAADAKPDGRVLLIQSNTFTVLKHLNKNVTIDPVDEFVPIALAASLPNVLVISKDLPPETLAEYKSFARGNAAALIFGSAGVGTINHLLGLMLHKEIGASPTYVQYASIPQRQGDLMAGRLTVGFDIVSNVLAVIQSGRVRPLAVTGMHRSQALPDVPTFHELGMPQFDKANYWVGLFAPRDTPADIVNKLNGQINQILKDTTVQSKLENLGINVDSMTQEEFQKLVRDENQRWTQIIATTKLNE